MKRNRPRITHSNAKIGDYNNFLGMPYTTAPSQGIRYVHGSGQSQFADNSSGIMDAIRPTAAANVLFWDGHAASHKKIELHNIYKTVWFNGRSS